MSDAGRRLSDRCYGMHTMVRKNTQPELDSLWDAQLVKLS